MKYKDHEFQYEKEIAELMSESDEERSSRKQYRRGRPMRTARRRTGKVSGSPRPSVGIGGRRNRRWSW